MNARKHLEKIALVEAHLAFPSDSCFLYHRYCLITLMQHRRQLMPVSKCRPSAVRENRSSIFDPHRRPLYNNFVSSQPIAWRVETLAAGHVEAPAVPWTANDVPSEITITNWAATMTARVLNRIERAPNVEQRYLSIADLDCQPGTIENIGNTGHRLEITQLWTSDNHPRRADRRSTPSTKQGGVFWHAL